MTNKTILTLSGTLTRISDLLSSTKLIIPWLLTSLGVPVFFTGLLVPIRESGSMLPQILIKNWIKQQPTRKYIYLISSVVQALALILLVVVTIYTVNQKISTHSSGYLVLISIGIYSFARCFSSVTSSDILGKCIPKSQRGQLSGRASSLAGAVTFVFGLLLVFFLSINTTTMLVVLGISALLMAVSGGLYHFISEQKTTEVSDLKEKNKPTKNANNPLEDWYKLKSDKTFINFVITRALMISSALATPYIIILAQQTATASSLKNISYSSYGLYNLYNLYSLGTFIAISGLASLVSGRFWGKLADKNSKCLMQITALATAGICIAVAVVSFCITHNQFDSSVALPLYVLSFFLLSVTHQGVRLARSTYVVDIATGNQRTTYVAISNSLIGLILLIIGLFSALLAQFTTEIVLLFFGAMSLLAVWYGHHMQDVNFETNSEPSTSEQ